MIMKRPSILAARDTTQDPEIYVVEGVKQPWIEITDATGTKRYEQKKRTELQEIGS